MYGRPTRPGARRSETSLYLPVEVGDVSVEVGDVSVVVGDVSVVDGDVSVVVGDAVVADKQEGWYNANSYPLLSSM